MKHITLAAALIGFAAPALAQEENVIAMDKAPKAAMDAAMAQAKGVTFDKVQIDNDEATETYEFSGKMANGMMVEVDVLADGTLEELEEQIDKSALPESVMATLTKNLPNFEPAFIEKSTRPNNLVVYEFEGKHDGKEIDVEINADGSNYKMIDDLAG